MNAPLPVTPSPTPTKAPALALDPRTFTRGLSCVHCGLCLPACPTFTETGHEADSPRGRIQLMLGLADGAIAPSESVRRHLDLCLDCRACETACPSGVVYHELIEETRARLADSAPRSGQDRLMRWIFFHLFVHPTRLKLALLPARLLQRIGAYALLRRIGLFNALPLQLRKMEQMLPPAGPIWPSALPERTRRGTGFQPVHEALESGGHDGSTRAGELPHGLKPRATGTVTVGFFAGCIGSVMFDDVNRQAIELLAAAGADVIAPPAQRCCGAIHHHNGAHGPAQAFARQNIDAFLPSGATGVDYIVTNIAGCGAMLRDYEVLLRDDPAYAERARQFASRVRDISEVLLSLGLPEMKHATPQTVTYHDACHLAHAQRVTAAPRQLLASIPGLTLVPLPESDMCCGAAGTYNLTQPAMSGRLADRKLQNIAATGAPACATGNVGCAMQIQSAADAAGQRLTVVHPVQLLHRAVFGPSSSAQRRSAPHL